VRETERGWRKDWELTEGGKAFERRRAEEEVGEERRRTGKVDREAGSGGVEEDMASVKVVEVVEEDLERKRFLEERRRWTRQTKEGKRSFVLRLESAETQASAEL